MAMKTLRLWTACFSLLWTLTATAEEDWPTATPEEVGMDPAPLAQMLAELPPPKKHGLHSLLVARQGRLVLEEYWQDHDRDTVHDLRSATKSITSLLLGIAVARGAVKSVSDPLLPYLAEAYPDLRGAAQKQEIRLSHLLTMSSGLDCDDRDRSTRGQEDRMYRQRDWVRHFLELEVVHPPGEVSQYCTGGVVALGRVIAEASGLPVPEFARRHLFGPLGIRGERWSFFDKDRQTDTGGHLYMRPVDLAKIGQLILQEGRWAGKQLVPADWLAESFELQTRLDGGKPYGYLWWFAGVSHGGKTWKVIFASGNGGQFLFILPDFELVMVATGGNYNSPRAGLPLQLLSRYVVPSVIAEKR